MKKKIREIQSSCRDLADEIGLITSGKIPGKGAKDLAALFIKLKGLCEEAIQEIQIATGEKKIGEHQYHPELMVIAGGKIIPKLFYY